jgi:predicted alpha/beta superfamily hydrolase
MKTTLSAITLALAATFTAHAQYTPPDIEAQPYVFPYGVEVFDLPTSSNGVNYRLYVRPPLQDPARRSGNPGVFYVLDGNWYFPTLASELGNTEFFGHTPNGYMVGIGYSDVSADMIEFERARDYTPTSFTPPDESHPLTPQDYQGSGHAAEFLQVLEEEIIPFIEHRYEIDNSQRALVGKSYAGLFASYTLLTRPDLFRQFVIISPSLWWDDFMLPREDRAMAQLEVTTRNIAMPAPTRVVFTAGSDEERLGMVSDVNYFTEALTARNDPNLDFTYRVLDGERHESIFPRAVMTSFRLLANNIPWDEDEVAE